MGKSSGRRKKGGSAVSTAGNNPAITTTTGGDHHLQHQSPAATTTTTPPPASRDHHHHHLPNGVTSVDASAALLKRAHELKEEGNRRFQARDYSGALEQYDLALRLTPRSHPDRAVFHSNRAACLMQMRPVDHESVAAECTLALLAQPRFPRALLRRARALESLGRRDAALHDVQALLIADPTNPDALELFRRLVPNPTATTTTTTTRHELTQQDLLSRPSPAALGASAVRGAPIGGLGPCLPSRTAPKKSSSPPPPPSRSLSNNKQEKLPQTAAASKTELKQPPPPVVAVSKATTKVSSFSSSSSSLEAAVPQVKNNSVQVPKACSDVSAGVTRWRPLKLVYDHDIRLAQMPANCSFRVLREVVSKRFPSSKSVLIKYKDADGDLVTVTGTTELRSAELYVDKNGSLETGKVDALQLLRLHIVEVSPEQEPPLPEEEEKPVEDEELVKADESLSGSSGAESVAEIEENGIVKTGSEEEVREEKTTEKECNHAECKEVEIDDWLFEFAQLFRTNVGIDPDAHLDLHELGMELCSEALEETVTSEEAQDLFDMAAAKFQEVAALAFFNWGNVHMCAARKRVPLDESSSKEVMSAQLQAAYDWVRARYDLAGQKYEEALQIKPDFYEGLLTLGQQHFEMVMNE